MAATGKGAIARMTAQRFGCKDEKLLTLIENLASREIVVGTPVFTPAKTEGTTTLHSYYVVRGTMDDKPFQLTLEGPAIDDFC
ncbi:MAG TPA: hypothetical protein VGJ33_16205 [Candidatus Angelobacter sp.]|jgi:hypothetical protein